MELFLSQSIEAVFNHFISPNTRLFWGYLASTLAILLVFYRLSNSQRSFLSYMFPKKIWLHTSAKWDYVIWLVNIVIKIALITPFIFGAAPVAIWISQTLESVFGDIANVTGNRMIIAASFTLLIFVLDDFTRFYLHYLLHRIPALWHIHKVHHSAQVLTPITVYRAHPIESLLHVCRLTLVHGTAIGLGFYLFGNKLQVIDVLGANIGVFLFNLAGSNLRHSHVWWSWGEKIENWFISPAQHQIHHSNERRYYHKNMGAALAVWDRLFGTHIVAAKVDKPITFGVDNEVHNDLYSIYLKPLKDVFTRR